MKKNHLSKRSPYKWNFMIFLMIWSLNFVIQIGAVEYTDCISAEG